MKWKPFSFSELANENITRSGISFAVLRGTENQLLNFLSFKLPASKLVCIIWQEAGSGKIKLKTDILNARVNEGGDSKNLSF